MIITALPIITGPIVFILTFEHGLVFGESAAGSAILGILLLVIFCLSYAHLSKYFNCIMTLLLSWLITFVLIYLLKEVVLEPVIAFFIVIISLFAAPYLLPKYDVRFDKQKTPVWEIVLRMIAVLGLVMTITSLAQLLGPNVSGLLAPFLIASSVLAVFLHRFYGADVAINVIHGFL